jgi:hypothetical protein
VDSNFISALIGAVVGGSLALVGSFGAIYLQQRVAQTQAEHRQYQEKTEEMQEFAIQVRQWMDFEFTQWWWLRYDKVPRGKNTLACPIARLVLLAERYEPALNTSISKMREVVAQFEQVQVEVYLAVTDLPTLFEAIQGSYERFKVADQAMEAVFQPINHQFSHQRAGTPLKQSGARRSVSQWLTTQRTRLFSRAVKRPAEKAE